MLVCNVSLRPPRTGITADIAEIAAALDDLGSGSGQVVFATLVDDPASVRETVDAYLGEIMLEAASAVDSVVLLSVYDVLVSESASAADVPDATSGITTITWDPATVTAVTLSSGNLVATNTGTTSADQGAKVASTAGKTSGKYYFENFISVSVNGGNCGIGIGTTASTYTGIGGNATTGSMVFDGTGNIYTNGSNTGISIGASGPGSQTAVAIDLDNRKIWFRKVSGNWNNSGTANPATNTGGITIPAGTMVPFTTFGGTSGSTGNVHTTNFGASAFVAAVPSGFTAGWPV